MNVADTKPYNADFDGDEMNGHATKSGEAETELRYLACIPNQLISPANNKSIIGIFQDNMIGSYLFTREGIKFTDKQMMNLMMKTNKFDTKHFQKQKTERYTNFEVLSDFASNDFELQKFFVQVKRGILKFQIHVTLNGIISRGQLDKGSFGGRELVLSSVLRMISQNQKVLISLTIFKVLYKNMRKQLVSVLISVI